ncbi:MAG: hypothetical protein V4459_15380 [Pseudomonadota bacterium]
MRRFNPASNILFEMLDAVTVIRKVVQRRVGATQRIAQMEFSRARRGDHIGKIAARRPIAVDQIEQRQAADNAGGDAPMPAAEQRDIDAGKRAPAVLGIKEMQQRREGTLR